MPVIAHRQISNTQTPTPFIGKNTPTFGLIITEKSPNGTTFSPYGASVIVKSDSKYIMDVAPPVLAGLISFRCSNNQTSIKQLCGGALSKPCIPAIDDIVPIAAYNGISPDISAKSFAVQVAFENDSLNQGKPGAACIGLALNQLSSETIKQINAGSKTNSGSTGKKKPTMVLLLGTLAAVGLVFSNT